MSQCVTKPTKWHMHPAKTWINFGIRSESLLFAQWVAKDPSFLHADSEDGSDWADAQADLSLHWVHMPFCRFCHALAHIKSYFLWKKKKKIRISSSAENDWHFMGLTLVLLNPDIPCFANIVDPDQLASEEASWSGSALFAIKNANL